MAIKLIANYSKRLGLPGYSSHQFSVSVETELTTANDIAAESERLYRNLQNTVDAQMLNTGFVPPADYGMEAPTQDAAQPENITHVTNWQNGSAWKCSDKQKGLILKLVEEHQLDKSSVESLAVDRFGKGVRQLNKIEASGLIDELLETHGGRSQSGTHGNRDTYRKPNGKAAA